MSMNMEYMGFTISPNYNSRSPETKYNILYYDKALEQTKVLDTCSSFDEAKTIIDAELDKEYTQLVEL